MRKNTPFQRELNKGSTYGTAEQGLTVREISPNWSKRLFSGRGLPFPLSPKWVKWYFELDSPSKCVIGEAYGYSSSYENTCKVCNRLGWSFGASFLLRSSIRLAKDAREFAVHWNKEHASFKSSESAVQCLSDIRQSSNKRNSN